MNAPTFFDIEAVRRLTLNVELARSALVVASANYGQLGYELYEETDELHLFYQQAQRDYADACVLLVNAIHSYWPEFFSPF